jgi:hypothetical protein
MWEIFVPAGAAVLLGIIIYFRLRRPVHRGSEIAARYKFLTDRFVGDKHVLHARGSHKSVNFKVREGSDLHTYSFTEVDGKLIVVWTLNSKIHGQRGKEWAFNLPVDQQQVYEAVMADLKNYQRSLYRE